MHLEEFSEGKSFLHKCDPRVKLLVFSTFAILCAISKGIMTPLLFLIYSVIFLVIGRIPIKPLLNRLLAANFFIFFLWLFVPFSYAGIDYFHIGLLKISKEGILYVLSITLKCNAIIIATISLISTSTLFSLAHALLHFKVPRKLIVIFFLFYRYISVMHEEYDKLKRAVLARGFVPKTSFHTYRTYAYLIGALLLKSFERAEEVYKAMLCRGFSGFFPLLEHFYLRKKDLVFGFLTIFISLSIFFFNFLL